MQSFMHDQRQYELTRRPLRQAGPLPAWCYADKDWYERELELIFRKEWLCVGRVEQIPNTGDYFTIEMIKQPLVVVRDGDAVRVHLALCRHRGAIVAEGKGHCRSFVCPYHSWTYALNGQLVGIPGSPHPLAGVEGFRNDDYGLMPVRSDVWGGFIFITFNADAPPLKTWLGDLPSFLADYDIEQMQWTHTDTYEVDCNWKIWLENAFENYHVATVHRQHYDPKNPQNWQFERPSGPWEAMFSKRSVVAYSGLPEIEGLSDDRKVGLYHIWLQPSLQIIITSSYMKYRQYLPDGPDKLRLYENWTFPRSTVERPDFKDIVGPEYYHKYSQIIREDLTINPVVQRAMQSGSFRPGRYSLEEYVVHRIGNYVIDKVVGPDDPHSRALREGTVSSQAAE
jgi:choline monooxygenase